MRYEVEITDSAAAELEKAFEWIRSESPLNAETWRDDLLERAASLERFPKRCPLAPENEGCRREIRHLVHGNYRLLFTIAGTSVYILHVRHGARALLNVEELQGPM
ncbi:MAG: type II toxin-antitoxin system RelE/ParE family toxin [Planctomycetes bacterium]|nr:type II toxin-antitoxin system RelE/ParE family toxin [Planctomycetota bacterium]